MTTRRPCARFRAHLAGPADAAYSVALRDEDQPVDLCPFHASAAVVHGEAVKVVSIEARVS